MDLKMMTDESMARLLRLGMDNEGMAFASSMVLLILLIGVIHAFFFTEDGLAVWPAVLVVMAGLGGYFFLLS